MSKVASSLSEISRQYNDYLIANIEGVLETLKQSAEEYEQSLVALDATALPDTSVISNDETLLRADELLRKLLVMKGKTEAQKEATDLIAGSARQNESVAAQYARECKKCDTIGDDWEDTHFETDEIYKGFRERVWEIRHPNQAFYFMNEERDDDIETLTQVINIYCPISVRSTG
jgi:hypothetical protein